MEMSRAFDRGAFGARIKGARKGRRISQERAAAALGVEQSTVSRWETGDTLPDLPTFSRMCDLYGVTMTAMLDADESPAEVKLRLIRAILEGPTQRATGDVLLDAVDHTDPDTPPARRRGTGD